MPIIIAQDIHRTFGKEPLLTHVLRGVNVTVEEGEFVAIMGKSGAGKSTFMYQLSVLDTPSSGRLFVDGTDVMALSEKERTSFRLNTLGYVFQDYALVPDLSARENVMMPLLMRGELWQDATAKADAAIDSVGLKGKYPNLPAELSGGEQQRVAIARAIASAPKIIFADEPTANLDSISSKQVIELISDLNRTTGQTIVMVTHEREYALGANRILHMEDGVIVLEEKLRPLHG
jgi:putative ABC transport system ATP-binding protein